MEVFDMRGRKIVRAIALLVLVSYPSTSFAYLSLPADWQYPARASQESAPDSTATTSDTCLTSQLTGKLDADAQHSSTGYSVAGFCSGVLLGLIGTGVITLVAATTSPDPKYLPDSASPTCYVDGYHSKARSKNIYSAVGGGILGTMVFLAVYLSTQ